MPREAHLASGVAGLEESEELGLTPVVEAFVALSEQPPRPVERVVLVAPVAEGLVLDPAATLVQLRIRELHHMERIRDLPGVGERIGEGLPVRAR
jgi:hypothetical protein